MSLSGSRLKILSALLFSFQVVFRKSVALRNLPLCFLSSSPASSWKHKHTSTTNRVLMLLYSSCIRLPHVRISNNHVQMCNTKCYKKVSAPYRNSGINEALSYFILQFFYSSILAQGTVTDTVQDPTLCSLCVTYVYLFLHHSQSPLSRGLPPRQGPDHSTYRSGPAGHVWFPWRRFYLEKVYTELKLMAVNMNTDK